MNSKPKCLKKTESLPVELGIVSLRDALLSRRDSRVLESTLNDVSFNKSTIIDQENGNYNPSSDANSSLTTHPSTPPTTLVRHNFSPPATAPLSCKKVIVVSIGTQTHSSHSCCTNETGGTVEGLEHSSHCYSKISSSRDPTTTTSVSSDQAINQTHNGSPTLLSRII